MDKEQKTPVQIKLAPGYAEKFKTIAAQMGRKTYGEVVQLWIDRHLERRAHHVQSRADYEAQARQADDAHG